MNVLCVFLCGFFFSEHSCIIFDFVTFILLQSIKILHNTILSWSKDSSYVCPDDKKASANNNYCVG